MGLEFLVMFLLGVLFTSSLAGIGLWVWNDEQKKHRFADALRADPTLKVGAVVSGDLARPLSLDLEVDGTRAVVSAVVRGEKALWHVELAGLDLALPGMVVVVERAFASWSRAARGKKRVDVDALGARHTCFVDDEASLSALDVGALVRAIDGRDAPISIVVEKERVFVEAPRTPKHDVVELLRVVARARSVVAVVEGRTPPELPRLLEPGRARRSAMPPSGIPVLVPLPPRQA